MSLKLSRKDFSWSRSKKVLPVFFLLWGGGLLLALLYLFTVRSHLQKFERDQTESLLDTYLAGNRSANLFSGAIELQRNTMLQGLAFIRIMQGSDQVVMVGDQAGALSFNGLVNLSPAISGVWLPVGMGKEKHLLTIILRRYDNGLLIQAGKDGQEGYALFDQLVRDTIFIVVCSIILLWPLSLYFIKQSLTPLITTREKIGDLIERSKTGLLPEQGNGPELDSLYSQINQLIRQNRNLVSEMQQSLDNVAHDLRTPMTRLRSVAEYGLQAEDDTSRLRDALSDCLEESERVLAMLKIMMSVAEAESGTMRLELNDCDILSSLQQVVNLYEYVAEERKITVQLQAAEADKPVRAIVDRTRISQVWANLLDNGIKYGREGGWVKIGVQAIGGHVVISFADNGMGISESERGKIWERLYRGDRSRSQPGLGLGLSYVHAVVTAHHGKVLVESTLHEGSQFVVRLPVVQVSTQEKSHISGE